MRTAIKPTAKLLAHGLATLGVSPFLVSYWLRSNVFGADRALFSSSQMLALAPGLFGQYIRRAFYRRVLTRFDRSSVVEFGTLFSRRDAEIHDNVYIGPMCHLGLVTVQSGVLIASSVSIPSGPRSHGIDKSDLAIREQPGSPNRVVVGAGSWIGAAAVVLADIGQDTVVAAGSVVTRPLPSGVVAAGVPAKIIRQRDASASDNLKI